MKAPALPPLATLLAVPLALACGTPAAPKEPLKQGPSAALSAEPARPASTASPAPATTVAPATSPTPPAAPPARARKAPFPPAAIAPPEPRMAQAGDGQWTPVTEAPRAADGPLLYRTTLHPHPQNKWVYVVLVAVDLTRVELSLVAGTKEPVNPSISAEERGGLVPLAQQPRLLAVFNGGFQESHGHYGMRIGDKTFVKPRADACTIVLRDPSHVDIGTFSELSLRADETYRQTPPCLVENGIKNPLLDRTPKKWGGAEDGRKDIRRTALAIDESGEVLYFAFADWITAAELGSALVTAGVKSAAELDINWSFTRFLFFGPAEDGSGLEVTGTLVDQIEHRKLGYVQKSEPRDFFYLTAAHTAGALSR